MMDTFSRKWDQQILQKKRLRGEDAALRARTETNKMWGTWEEQFFEVGVSQKAKADFQGQMGVFAWSELQGEMTLRDWGGLRSAATTV